MSAPDTNIAKQKRRHRGALVGIVAAVLLAVIAWLVLSAPAPEGSADKPAAATQEQPTGTQPAAD